MLLRKQAGIAEAMQAVPVLHVLPMPCLQAGNCALAQWHRSAQHTCYCKACCCDVSTRVCWDDTKHAKGFAVTRSLLTHVPHRGGSVTRLTCRCCLGCKPPNCDNSMPAHASVAPCKAIYGCLLRLCLPIIKCRKDRTAQASRAELNAVIQQGDAGQCTAALGSGHEYNRQER